MASITHFQDVLQRQWFQKIQFIGEYLRPEDLTEAAAAAKYRWRNRLWPPMQMLWAFLVQVLHPGWSSAGRRPVPLSVPRHGSRDGTVRVAALLDRLGPRAGSTAPGGTPCGQTKAQAPQTVDTAQKGDAQDLVTMNRQGLSSCHSYVTP